jgi:hypothetical protein
VPAPQDTWRSTTEDNNYLISISDLMVGMLFFFIIVLGAFGLNYRTAEDQAARIQTRLRTTCSQTTTSTWSMT